jgi:hypothetical protein
VSVLVDGDVPVGMGLSSSAALSCSVALALRDLAAPDLAVADLVDVARRAENDFVGAPTGILDQSASLLCTAGHALFLDTRDRRSEQVPLDLRAAGLELLVVDTGTTHDHATGGYGDRRRECELAAERLGVRALRDVPDVAALAPLDDGTPGGGVLLRRAGTSSPRTRGCWRSWRSCAAGGGRRRSGRRSPPGTRRCATTSRSPPSSSTPPSTPPWRSARQAPAWWAAVSAAAPSSSWTRS